MRTLPQAETSRSRSGRFVHSLHLSRQNPPEMAERLPWVLVALGRSRPGLDLGVLALEKIGRLRGPLPRQYCGICEA